MDITNLITLIKANKKYKDISDDVVKTELEKYFKANSKAENYKDKFIVKDIRTKLHKNYASFQMPNQSKKERVELLAQLDKNPGDIKIVNKLLGTNRSTKERIEFYSQLYEDIFSITGEPNSILDLGCGINPISFPYMKLEQANYYACDIDNRDIKFLNDFFKMMQIEGLAETKDLSLLENFSSLPEADICFMFKLLDVLEKKGHKYSEDVIKILIDKCQFIVASFATYTVGGREMNFPERGWIERMLTRIGLKFKMLEYSNEIFYVVYKSKKKN